MHWKVLATSLALGLLGCNNPEANEVGLEETGILAATIINSVAWSERVEIGGISSTNPLKLRIKVGNNQPFDTQPIFQGSGRVVFDLPNMPILPNLPAGLPATISRTLYNQTPSADQLASYSTRGQVLVQVLNAANQEVTRREYQPYGAVEPGQLTLIRDGSCVGFNPPSGFVWADSLTAQVGQTQVCYVTASFSTRGTSEAMGLLRAARPASSVDKNVLHSLDQSGANAYDPTCEQIGRWLNPIGGSGFSNINMSQLANLTNTASAQVNNNRGVSVHVVGGGFGANDGFSCPLANLHGHDRHVGDLIRTLAPNATILAKEVCNDQGSCAASRITRALLEIGASSSGNTLINTSLGGPLANTAMFRALQLLQDRVLLVASGGNGAYASRHYPASYSSSLPTPGPLNNVIAVGAAGMMNGSWGIAGFNTRRNGEISAPGINLCPSSALDFRCKNTAPFSLDDIGLTGSSFAAPVVTGIAALYLEHALPTQTLTPIRLRQCLNNFSLINPSLSGMVWFSPNGC